MTNSFENIVFWIFLMHIDELASEFYSTCENFYVNTIRP